MLLKMMLAVKNYVLKQTASTEKVTLAKKYNCFERKGSYKVEALITMLWSISSTVLYVAN